MKTIYGIVLAISIFFSVFVTPAQSSDLPEWAVDFFCWMFPGGCSDKQGWE